MLLMLVMTFSACVETPPVNEIGTGNNFDIDAPESNKEKFPDDKFPTFTQSTTYFESKGKKFTATVELKVDDQDTLYLRG